MNPLLNIAIICLVIGAALFFIAWRVQKSRSSTDVTEQSDLHKYQLSSIEAYVKDQMTELTTMNLYNLGLQEDEYNRLNRRRQELKEALKNCNTGDLSSKTYVKEYMYDLLLKTYEFNEENVNWAIPFHTPNQLTARDMFDTLLFHYQKEHGKHALGTLIDEFQLAAAKADGGYRITEQEIRDIYKKTIKRIRLEDKIKIITQRVYSQFKGFGVIDDIRDQVIDGVSGGVSGLPARMENLDDEELLIESMTHAKSGLNSIWVMYQGKTIHFSFLQFEHEAEVRRVVQNIYKYGYPGQLSETRPYIINEMHDGSRVTVVRPKFAESWAFFIRKKYDLKMSEAESLIIHLNAELPIELIQYLMKGNRVTAITGAQGSGKTTLLMVLIGFIHKALNLRIQETSFELNLRNIYPDRNILSFQETDMISGQDGLDLQKKTDGHVTILGEVATDPVAAWMIQTAQVASLFTLFTHHAKTFKDLVYALRNSLLKVGMFSNEAIAEQQVVSVLEFDIHLRQDYDGSRYIERITECIPIDTASEMAHTVFNPKATKDEKMDMFLSAGTIFFNQQTQRQQFEERNLVEFRDGKYVAVSPMSEARQKEIERLLSIEERQKFREFVERVWGNVA
ncbi:Flp pilus assembly complex ATPase component TadA (plasmid) [Cytobacillus solani]|uniref:ATPase, T2SS/T4P/T4SS family n=1 Tax=Cytobacillus solani TaxID=1637975 RepID=UPI00207A2F20|nr:ATPase, T2SS/T4P/T4SS family [Cytobacillus solani]USK57793.1 Flp pilus assembly complex ATPase component TadA [Cytobacillus solani]